MYGCLTDYSALFEEEMDYVYLIQLKNAFVGEFRRFVGFSFFSKSE